MALKFPDLGKHCSHPGCNQLDFLPFKCHLCDRIFCLDHHKLKDHGCTRSDRIVPDCPLCGQAIPLKPGEDVNARVDAHIRAGCLTEAPTKLAHHCDMKGCKSTELGEIRCKYCKRNFCVRHRLPPQHNCVSLKRSTETHTRTTPTSGSTPAGDSRMDRIRARIRELNDSFGRAKGKKKATAQRIQLMKVKKSAKGRKSIPEERRYYLQVVYPDDCKTTPLPLFFDTKWTIGRVLDEAAERGRVRNYNDKKTKPYTLRLYSLQSGEPLPNLLKLNEIPRDVLYSGDSILLEKDATSS